MPLKKFRSREGNPPMLPDLVSKFPFQIGDEVEMKSHESGYRGAWFRVQFSSHHKFNNQDKSFAHRGATWIYHRSINPLQVKKFRLDRKGNIWSTMVYKDYTDESEEEIRVYEKDPASDERILMVRPLPPPSVKESKFNKSVHTKMCVVYRDEWEVGDVVDWWYHHCWWAAKVISVVGDGRFQLVCPAPPGGEGGVYLANSRDLRPSLKWSIATQWTAPPSKEIGKIPCARIVRLLDSDEVAGFATPVQDQMPHKRGRPKLVRGVNNPIVRKEPTIVTPGKESGMTRRPRVMQLNHSPFHSERVVEAPHTETIVPRKRGRPRKVDQHEEATKKRLKPIVIKIIHPRQDPGYEKVEHILKSPLVDESRPMVDEERKQAISPIEMSPEVEMRQEVKQGNVMLGKGDEDKKWDKKESPTMEKQSEKENTQQIEQKTSLVMKQIHHQEKRQGIKQKRSVIRLPDNYNRLERNQTSNGHYVKDRRQKLEHIRRVSNLGLGDETKRQHNVQEEDDKIPHNVDGGIEKGGYTSKCGVMLTQSKSRKQQMKLEENEVVTCVSYTRDIIAGNKSDLVPPELSTLESTLLHFNEGKENSADQTSGLQQSKDEKKIGERQVEVFSSNFASKNPMSREVNGETYKEALDLKVLKVLNAYEEAFTNTTLCLEAKNNTCLNHDPSTKEYNKDAFINDHSCPTSQQKLVVATKDLSIVTTHEYVIIEDTQSPKKKSSLAHDPSLANSNFAKLQECLTSCNQKKPEVNSTCKGISSLDTKSSTLQDRHRTKKATNANAILSHEILIGTKASSMDTVSLGRSPDPFFGRYATITTTEDMKDPTSNHGGVIVGDERDSWSSLEPSRLNQSRRSANVCPNASQDPIRKSEKSSKNDFSLLQKRNITRPITKRKVSLSRKLVDQARREVSARRRTYKDIG